MKVRRSPDVRLRRDDFGGICYIGHRDDFFAADKPTFDILLKLPTDWWEIDKDWTATCVALARLGICETADPITPEVSYSGPSFLGVFPEIPAVTEPLVLNCFCTAYCPLQCIYCHADDLMQEFRPIEVDDDLGNVITTASSIPSMVAVVTGGDPLSRPARARRLIEGLYPHKAIVLDTSGVGQIDELLDILVECNVHVRVSLDSVEPRRNAMLRPINRRYTKKGESSIHGAQSTIERCLANGLGVTVQSVVTAQNDNPKMWRDLRDRLISIGVRNWVLHIAVKGGAARTREIQASKGGQRSVLPSPDVRGTIWSFIKETIAENLPIDIRCTDTDSSPNSVLLVNSKGDLFTEGYAHNGKVRLFDSSVGRPELLRALWPHVDRFGHAKRYLNWNRGFFDGRSLNEICYNIPIPPNSSPTSGAGSIVETEGKFAVRDLFGLRRFLSEFGYTQSRLVYQRDEYYDDAGRNLASLDYVVRVRWEEERPHIGIKGPRFYSADGGYSRIELEFSARDGDEVATELQRRGLVLTFVLEKRRSEYSSENGSLLIALDEIPEIGFFIELEGPLAEVQLMHERLHGVVAEQSSRENYTELFRRYKRMNGISDELVKGAVFDSD
jgi:predicted adenylyl cyclase CyaB